MLMAVMQMEVMLMEVMLMGVMIRVTMKCGGKTVLLANSTACAAISCPLLTFMFEKCLDFSLFHFGS